MTNIFYNYFFIFFFLYYFTIKLNINYFKINNNLYLLSLLFHIFLTFLYTFIFPVGDWETYLGLENKTFSDFRIESFFSSHLIFNIITFLKNIIFLNNLNVIIFFSLVSFLGIVIFVNNLIKIGVEKKNSLLILIYSGT